ncbi:MAG: lipoprotein [Pseudomonadota bacterium]
MVFSSQILGLVQSTSSRHGLATVVIALSALAGCGQKGPLYYGVPPVVQAAPAPLPQSAVVQPAMPAASAVR